MGSAPDHLVEPRVVGQEGHEVVAHRLGVRGRHAPRTYRP